MKNWSDADIEVMREHYPHLPSEDVAKMLGYTLNSVYQKARRLKLSKSAEFYTKCPRGVPPSKEKALPDEVVRKVDELKLAGFSGAKIARTLQVHVNTIRNALARRGTYRSLPPDPRLPANPYANNGGKRRKHVEPALTPDQVRKIRTSMAAGARYKTLEREYGVGRGTVFNALRGYAPYQGIA